MPKEININSKLISFDGIIGRIDFAVNLVFIWSIVLILQLPYYIWLSSKINTNLSDILNLHKLLLQSSSFLIFWLFCGGIIAGFLYYSNISRRLNDIYGKENKFANYIYTFLITMGYFSIFFPMGSAIIISICSFITTLILLFKSGKITSQLPYDCTKQFNWGAFFGNWIWGLFNNSYIPLLYLLLSYTPFSFYFLLYCGLKGNEWAYKNKKWANIKSFEKSQRNQSIIWIVLNCIILPVIIVSLVFGILFLSMTAMSSTTQSKDTTTRVESFMDKMTNLLFKSYTIEENQNTFYMRYEYWDSLAFDKRVKMLDYAANIASEERRKAYLAKHPNERFVYFSKSDELPRTKIYDAETNKLLAEYIPQTSNKNDKDSFFDYVVNEMKSYRFYN